MRPERPWVGMTMRSTPFSAAYWTMRSQGMPSSTLVCTAAEAGKRALAAIEKEGLLENVRRVSAHLRETCKVGPVTGFQGLGFLAGLKMNKPAKDIQKALLARNILAGTAGDPSILRLLPAFILKEEHIDLLRAALSDL